MGHSTTKPGLGHAGPDQWCRHAAEPSGGLHLLVHRLGLEVEGRCLRGGEGVIFLREPEDQGLELGHADAQPGVLSRQSSGVPPTWSG